MSQATSGSPEVQETHRGQFIFFQSPDGKKDFFMFSVLLLEGKWNTMYFKVRLIRISSIGSNTISYFFYSTFTSL